MPDLPARPDLTQLRHQAKDLLRAAKAGDPRRADTHRRRVRPRHACLRSACRRPRVRLRQLAEAEARSRAARGPRQPGSRAPLHVARRRPDARDGVDGALVRPPEGRLAARLRRHAAVRHLPWRVARRAGHGALARALLRAGAPVDGEPGDRETPLITAASYGDAAVARVLIEEGADLEARASRTPAASRTAAPCCTPRSSG